MKKMLIIGCGAMGGALLSGGLSSGVLHSKNISVVEMDKNTRQGLEKNLNVTTYSTLHEVENIPEIIILGVKPQDFQRCAEELKPFLEGHEVIISIMTGISINSIKENLVGGPVIRTMPNLPIKVGKSFTAYIVSDDVPHDTLKYIEDLLNAVGITVKLTNEELMNSVTSLSATGVGIIYYCMEAFILAGQKMGFTDVESKLLVHQIFSGAAALIEAEGLSPNELRARVTSKGGTTAATVAKLDEAEVMKLFEIAFMAGSSRAVELSKSL